MADNNSPNDNVNDITDAEKRLQQIKDNPQEWGTISSKGTELINTLLPVLDLQNESDMEEVSELLTELASLRDPRSAINVITHWSYFTDCL